MKENIAQINDNANKKEINTREKILNVAIDLFSSNGYKEVSIREIAKEVGIKDASIYYHYSKKEDILDSIFEHFMEKMNKTEISNSQKYELLKESPMKLYHFGSESVKYQFSSIKMIKIMRLIFIELYHNPKIRNFFQKRIIEEPIDFWTFFFQELIDKKIIKKVNPKQLAENYYMYGMFKIFEVVVLGYPENPDEIDLNPIFDNIEKHFYFILDSVTIKKKDKHNNNKYNNKHKDLKKDKHSENLKNKDSKKNKDLNNNTQQMRF